MQPFEIDDIHATALANIEAEIIDAIDDYNAAVAAGNDELAQMIHLSIQGLQRRRNFHLKPSTASL
jgi:Holliday junction resolvasome RuvABC ATP-dependent DNA helicase subunit